MWRLEGVDKFFSPDCKPQTIGSAQKENLRIERAPVFAQFVSKYCRLVPLRFESFHRAATN